jgi:hypothetical protein
METAIAGDEEVILVCDHAPRPNWTQFERGEVVAAFADGTEVVPDFLALCNDCFALPMHELKANVVRRTRR